MPELQYSLDSGYYQGKSTAADAADTPPGTTTIRASHLRVGDKLVRPIWLPHRTVVAVQPNRDHSREVYVEYANGTFDSLNIDEPVTVAGDVPEWERELLGPTTTPVTQRPGGNPAMFSNTETEERKRMLRQKIERSKRELHFLNNLPAEPVVDPDSLEPVVLFFKQIDPETGTVESVTVVRSRVHPFIDSETGWRVADDGTVFSWDRVVRHLYQATMHLEIRQLNPGTVVHTTVPQAPAPKAARRTPVKRTAPAAKRTR